MAVKSLQLFKQMQKAISKPVDTRSVDKGLASRLGLEIADGAFRSLQDVQKYLDDIKTNLDDMDGLIKQYQLQFSRVQIRATDEPIEFIVNPDAPRGPSRKRGLKTIDMDKIDKIVIPKLEVLKKNFSLADEISEQVDELDKLYNSVAVNFRGTRGSQEMLKSIKTVQKTAESKLEKALKFLGDIGERHTPEGFRSLIRDTITYVSPELDFKAHKTLMYGYENKEDNLAFAVYLQLTDLTDDEGNVYPKFYIVFTCILKPAQDKSKVEPQYYLTVMHDFATPGKYSLGRRITSSEQASSTLGTMLEMENINTAIGTRPHNLDPEKVTRNKFRSAKKIHKIEVAPNSLSFLLIKGIKAAEIKEIAGSLYIDVKGMLGHIKKATISMKIETEEGRPRIKFTLTNLSKENEVSVDDLDFLKETFGLDDTKLRKVITIINDEN